MEPQLISRRPDGTELGAVRKTPISELPGILERAREGEKALRALGFEGRERALREIGARLKEDQEAIARIASEEMGKPLRESLGEARRAFDRIDEEISEIFEALKDEVLTEGKYRSTIVRDPYGVAACITPWNFPTLMPHQQIFPALAAGNAVIFKPSEEVPLTAEAYIERFRGLLPEGALTIVHGEGDLGAALVSSDVDLIVFTGSRAVGQRILREAAESFKRVILELGGKDPLIVLEDADLDAAAAFASRNSFWNAGQVCVSTERIFVHRDRAEEFIEKLIEHAQQILVGDPLEDGVRLGPMVNIAQKERVQKEIDEAVKSGAQLRYNGSREDGAFLGPIVLGGLEPSMPIARAETFGPVAGVIATESDEESIRLANDSRFGLGAVVFGSEERARAVARELRAGMVGINQGIHGVSNTPWVGARESGYGFHSGTEGHRQFAQLRVIHETIR